MLKIKGGKMKPYFQEEWFIPSFPIKMRILKIFFHSFLCIYKTIRKSPSKTGSPLIGSGTEHHSLVCIEGLKSHKLPFSKQYLETLS